VVIFWVNGNENALPFQSSEKKWIWRISSSSCKILSTEICRSLMDWYQCRRQKKFSEDQNILVGDAAVTYNSAFLHQIHSTHFCPESCIKIWNQCCSLFYSNNFATTKQPSSSWEICTCCKRNVSLEIIKILQKTLHEIFARMGPSTRLSAFLLNSCSKANLYKLGLARVRHFAKARGANGWPS